LDGTDKIFYQEDDILRMSYRIPPEDVLDQAIKDVLEENQVVNSQGKMADKVSKRLMALDPDYAVTGERVRKEAILNGLAKVEIHARESTVRSRAGPCPVCSSKMSRIKNRTIFDGTVTSGYKCTRCSYWTGVKRRVPIRYIFHGSD
jgi:hypothetical protein